MKCAKCGKELPEGSLFCDSCGTPVGVAESAANLCPRCGLPLDSGSTFCSNCGYQLVAASPAPVAPVQNAEPPVTPTVMPPVEKPARPIKPETQKSPVVAKETEPETPEAPLVEAKVANPESKPEKKKPKKGLIIAVVAAALVLIAGGVVGTLIYSNSKKKTPAPQPTAQVQKSVGGTATASKASDATVYDPIVKAYQAYQSSGFATQDSDLENTSLVGKSGTEAVVVDDPASETLVYSLKDINNDGTLELFVGVQEPGVTDVTFFDVWTTKDGKTILLTSPNHNTQSMAILSDGSIEVESTRNTIGYFSLPADAAELESESGMNNSDAATLSWAPLSDWKFADGSTAAATAPQSATIYTPIKGSMERQALMDAQRAQDGTSSQYIVDSLFSNGEWAIGWLEIAPGSDGFLAAWKKVDGNWAAVKVTNDDMGRALAKPLRDAGMPQDLLDKEAANTY